MVGVRGSTAFHTDRDEHGRPLSALEREKLLKPYLPASSQPSSSRPKETGKQGLRFNHKKRVRPAIRHFLHYLLFTIISLLFSIHVRIRQTYHALADRIAAILYYHHRTPELIRRDVRTLSKIPKHLSVILELPPEGRKQDRLEGLLNDACEIAAWSAGAGVLMLSIYERTGVLKSSLPHLHRRISRTMTAYYGTTSPNKPTISLRAPHLPSYSPPHSPESIANGTGPNGETPRPHLNILLISTSDGRQTLVDLTRTLASMAQDNKLQPSDISSDLIDAEISESVMSEPDLLICFGERVVLDGYPPWQVRLTEIYHAQDNVGGVGYHIFLRALYKYAKAEMRLGR